MEKVKVVKADFIWDDCNMGKATRIQSQTQLHRGDQEGVCCQGVGGICGRKTTKRNIRGERIPAKPSPAEGRAGGHHLRVVENEDPIGYGGEWMWK